jgi:tetratricopeptide (TPR) repeat protein
MTGRHTTLLRAFAVSLAVSSAQCALPSAVVRAQTLVREERAPEAVALLRDHLRLYPEDLTARRLLARVLALTGELRAARVEVDEMERRLPPGDPTPYLELGHAFELVHRYEEALASYDDAAQAAPSSPEGPREGGMRCARWGEAQAARPRLEEAVRRGARDAETWHALGVVRTHLHDLEGAEQAYREGALSDPKRAECWLGLATVAVLRGNAQSALEGYEQVLARRPRFAPAELGRAWALGKLGRAQEASRALDRAEELGAPAVNVAKQRADLAARASPEAR